MLNTRLVHSFDRFGPGIPLQSRIGSRREVILVILARVIITNTRLDEIAPFASQPPVAHAPNGIPQTEV
jgi:hypothetical protein